MEACDPRPVFDVQDSEFLRLLGYPRGHQPGERVRELMAWARDWFARFGRAWVYERQAALELTGETLRLDGVEFRSNRLQEQFRTNEVSSAMLVAVSAGSECEEQARLLWQEGKPDEYFFLESFGSAVVEDLVARASGRICDLAGHLELMAVARCSPGYTGWDIADQNKLFDVVARGKSRPFPGPIEVLTSGMLRPKKSLLAVFGLASARGNKGMPAEAPCESCAFSPCQYRRAPNAPARADVSGPADGAESPTAKYATNPRALRKWAAERVSLDHKGDGSIEAVFRFDGTTCSNMGRPLAFDYQVTLSGPAQRYVILESRCLPAPGDEGYQSTCAYLADADQFLQQIAHDKPLLGRPLEEVLVWERTTAPSGCHCTAESRMHNWGLALEAIHYSLVAGRLPMSASTPSPLSI
jgi:hypothetical protein